MASIINRPNGHRWIQFTDTNKKRQTLRLGKVPKRQAESVKVHVERLVAAKITGHSVADETSRWVAALAIESQVLLDKLVKIGLVEPSNNERTHNDSVTMLGPFIDLFIDEFTPTVKEGTVTTWTQTRRLLLEHFDANTELKSITDGHAIGFRNYLLTRDHTRIKRAGKLSESTIRRRCSCARQMFDYALNLELINKNPFATKKLPRSLPKPDQKFFVSGELAGRVMAKLPDYRYRLLFALARWGGLRIPSEIKGLRWRDIDWENMRITVHSPKTEHHEGHDKRVIPLFDELVGPLQDAWEMADEGEEYAHPLSRQVTATAMRKRVIAAIEATGAKVWPKLFVALRATRDTELRENTPGHVVDAWIGHNEVVARKNYLQITDDHFDKYTCKAKQNAKQYTAASPRTDLQTKTAIPEKPRELLYVAATCESVQDDQVGLRGLEQSQETPEVLQNGDQGEAECEANAEQELDANLQLIVDRWHELPDAIKKGILAMVRVQIDD